MSEQALPLRCYVCANAPGVWLSAILVAFATSEEEAREMMVSEGVADKIWGSDVTLREIPISQGAHLLGNGDY